MKVHQIPRSVRFGLGPVIRVKRVSVRDMREASACTPKHATPDGLWDVDRTRILLLSRLPKARALQVYFHELTHALVDVGDWVMHP